MKKLVLVDEESNKEVLLVTDNELKDMYTLFEDLEFYYNDVLKSNDPDDKLNRCRDKIQTTLEAFLFSKEA